MPPPTPSHQIEIGNLGSALAPPYGCVQSSIVREPGNLKTGCPQREAPSKAEQEATKSGENVLFWAKEVAAGRLAYEIKGKRTKHLCAEHHLWVHLQKQAGHYASA